MNIKKNQPLFWVVANFTTQSTEVRSGFITEIKGDTFTVTTDEPKPVVIMGRIKEGLITVGPYKAERMKSKLKVGKVY